MMKSLVAVGACYLDTILTVDHYPAEDEKLRAASVAIRRGGNTLNTLDVLVRLLAHRQSGAASGGSGGREGRGSRSSRGSHGRGSAGRGRGRQRLFSICVLPARDSSAVAQVAASFGPGGATVSADHEDGEGEDDEDEEDNDDKGEGKGEGEEGEDAGRFVDFDVDAGGCFRSRSVSRSRSRSRYSSSAAATAAAANAVAGAGAGFPAISLAHSIFRPEAMEPARSWIIRSAHTGSRTIVNHSGLAEMTVEEFALALAKLPGGGPGADDGSEDGLGRTPWFHFEGRIPETTLTCMRYVRIAYPDALISVEVEKSGRPGLQHLASEADVVFYSKSWAESKGYSDPHEFLQWQASMARKAFLLTVTWGAAGASGLRLPDRTYVSVPAHETPEPVIDTIGAGDTFIAGILYHLLTSPTATTDHPAAFLPFANRVAGLKVCRDGFEGLEEAMASPDPLHVNGRSRSKTNDSSAGRPNDTGAGEAASPHTGDVSADTNAGPRDFAADTDPDATIVPTLPPDQSSPISLRPPPRSPFRPVWSEYTGSASNSAPSGNAAVDGGGSGRVRRSGSSGALAASNRGSGTGSNAESRGSAVSGLGICEAWIDGIGGSPTSGGGGGGGGSDTVAGLASSPVSIGFPSRTHSSIGSSLAYRTTNNSGPISSPTWTSFTAPDSSNTQPPAPAPMGGVQRPIRGRPISTCGPLMSERAFSPPPLFSPPPPAGRSPMQSPTFPNPPGSKFPIDDDDDDEDGGRGSSGFGWGRSSRASSTGRRRNRWSSTLGLNRASAMFGFGSGHGHKDGHKDGHRSGHGSGESEAGGGSQGPVMPGMYRPQRPKRPDEI